MKMMPIATGEFSMGSSAGLREETPAVWLMDADGAVLAEAELAVDPLPGCLAIAGSDVVVGTVDGGVHRFATVASVIGNDKPR
jgi:hypothetical protein